MPRKSWFSLKVSGVGGVEDVVPIASASVGGSVGRRERIDFCGSIGWSCTYWIQVSFQLIKYQAWHTMCGLLGSVDTHLEARK
jgi:hypothetical protein